MAWEYLGDDKLAWKVVSGNGVGSMSRAKHVWVNPETREIAATDNALSDDEITDTPNEETKIRKVNKVDFAKMIQS